jgi:hypothetical protein
MFCGYRVDYLVLENKNEKSLNGQVITFLSKNLLIFNTENSAFAPTPVI